MRISDICSRSVACVGIHTTAREAAWKMSEVHTGTLVVTAQNGAPIGILTDRDLVLKVLAKGAVAEAVFVGDVMTREVITCKADEDIFDAAQSMRRHGVRRLPVLDDELGVIGLVSADDIYSALASHMKELGQALLREQLQELKAYA